MSSELVCLVAMRHLLMWWFPFFFCWLSGPSSSSFCRLYLVLLFWNHTFTWIEKSTQCVTREKGKDLTNICLDAHFVFPNAQAANKINDGHVVVLLI